MYVNDSAQVTLSVALSVRFENYVCTFNVTLQISESGVVFWLCARFSWFYLPLHVAAQTLALCLRGWNRLVFLC